MREERATDCLTISVPEAGRRYFGLSRNGSYEAAARGDIPFIKIGRKLRVPVVALERMLDQANGGASMQGVPTPVPQTRNESLRVRDRAPKLNPGTPATIENVLRASRPIYEQSRRILVANFEPKHSRRRAA